MTLTTSLLITGDASTALKAVDGLKQSVEQLNTAGKGAAGGVAALDRAQDAAAASSRAMAAAAATAGGAMGALGTGAIAAAGAVRQHSQAINDNDAAARRSAAGVRNLGQQFGDLGVQIGGGTSPIRAFATQAGQMGYALSEIGGKAGAVGAFLVGPWGIALTVAVSVLAPFVEKLLQGGEAADLAAKKLDEQKKSIDRLGLGLGSLAGQTLTARNVTDAFNAALANDPSALNAKNAQGLANARIEQANATYRAAAAEVALRQASARASLADLADGSVTRTGTRTVVTPGTRIRRTEQYSYQEQLGTNIARGSDGLSALARAQRDANEQMRQADLDAKALDSSYKALTSRIKTVAATTGRSSGAGALASAVTDASQQAHLAAAHSATAKAEAELTIARRRGAAELKAGTITQAEYTARLVAGEQAVNRAKDAEKAARGAKVEHAKATRDAAAAQRELDTAYADVTRKLDPIAEATREYSKQLAEIAKLRGAGRIGVGDDVALTISAQQERDAKIAAEQAAQFKRAFELSNPGELFEDSLIHAAVAASDRLKEGAAEAGSVLTRSVIGLGSILSDLFPGASSGAVGRSLGAGVQLGSLLGPQGQKREAALDFALVGISKGIGISDAGALKIGEYGSKAIRGAAEGALANSVFSPIAKGLGIKTSQTGAQIGGALGSAVGGPIGGIVGGIAGSVVGGLFKSTPSGKVSLTSATGDVTATGNNAAAKAAAAGLAGGVQDGLRSIAEQLGGTLGAFNVTLGQRHGDYRVTTGTSLKVKKGAKDFNDDEAGAVGYAVQLAISQGAVQGLSTAVQKAIESSSDVDAALKEALKVQDVELLAKGVAGQFDKAFADLEATAKERVRIAREYGLDVVSIEKRNAEDRVKLVEQLTRAQAGSLQALIEDLTSGNLFEGSALDQIDALNGRIATAKADLEAGVDGASDTLADLYRQRLGAQKDAYGTTSAYADSRNSTIAEAQAAIARVNAQVTAAQQSDPALKETNAALDENNSQNAELLDALRAHGGLLSQIAEQLGAGGAATVSAKLARLAEV